MPEEPITRAELEREAAHLRELIETTLSERAKALDLQSVEYHRRLGELNDAHARAERAVLATVPRELFENFVKENARWRETVVTEFSLLKGASASATRFFTTLTVLLSLAFTAITIVFAAITLWVRLK